MYRLDVVITAWELLFRWYTASMKLVPSHSSAALDTPTSGVGLSSWSRRSVAWSNSDDNNNNNDDDNIFIGSQPDATSFRSRVVVHV